MMGYLDKGKIPYKPNLSELTIKGKNGSFIKFDGLDNIGKKKSIEGINYIWIEELAGLSADTRITKREYALLDTICRAPPNPNRINQLFASFNPVDPLPNKWIVDITKRGDTKDTQILHINFEENPFLSEADRQTILRNAAEDASYNKVYRLGQWAVIVGKIYENWDIVYEMPEEYERRIWGLDFGYVNPAALIECRIIGRESWEQEHIYHKGLTNPVLAAMIESIVGQYEHIIADSSQSGDIAELKSSGLNVFPCWKAPGSVNSGIQTVQGFKTHLLDTSTNLIKEKSGYKWVTDADDEIKLFKGEQKPVDFDNHLMDAERYAINSVARKVKAGIVLTDGGEDYDPEEAMWTAQE
jgi:phage terminase large subunit